MIAWGANVNAQDTNGTTPLHLAVRAATNSTRSVRHLLIKGADREIRDKQGRTPWEIIEKTTYFTNEGIKEELRQYLVRDTIMT